MDDVIWCCGSWCTGVNRLQNISWCTFTWIDHADLVCGISRNEYRLNDTTVSTGPYQNLSLHLVSISFCYSHQSLISYLLWRGTIYFLSCTSTVWNRGYDSTFVCYCVMIDDGQKQTIFNNLAGTENDLNHVLSTVVDSEHEITNVCHPQYVDMSEIHSIFQNSPKEFLILTLNIQSVNATCNN